MEQQANPTLFTQYSYVNSATPGTACNASLSDTLPSGQLLCGFRYGVDSLPPIPAPATQLTTGAIGRIMDPSYRNPYTEQWNGGYSWQVTSDSVIEVEYVHVLGLHESKRQIPNPKINGVRNTDAALKAAGLPVIARIVDESSIGRSRYDGLNISYRKRMSRHFSVNTSYVLSRALGYNGASASFGNAPTDVLNIFAPHDFGYTGTDERHRWVLSGLLDLPYGIKFAPIMQLASGRAYTASEGISDVYGFGGGAAATHDIVLNSDPTNLLATKGYSTSQLQACLAANTCQQVPFGNLRGQAFFQWDARFSKQLKFKERYKLDLFFQAFDLTNRTNFGTAFGTNIRTSTFQVPTGFISASGVVVPHSFNGEFGAHFNF
jgi:hypothetical protein